MEEIHELERQVEHGNLFVHAALSEAATRMNNVEAVVNGLADLLVRGGAVDADELMQVVEATKRGIAEAGKQATLAVAIRADGPEPEVSAETIDCEARLPLCKAVCCRLRFALTVEEIEDGPIKWELGRPYFNRHGPDGYCHQFEGAGCSIYEQRPTPCRQYSCAKDARIWKDFAGRVINQEWIDANIGSERSPIELFMDAQEPA